MKAVFKYFKDISSNRDREVNEVSAKQDGIQQGAWDSNKDYIFFPKISF